MNIKEIIQQLRVTMDDAKGQDSHFDSWLTQNEGICKAIDALKILDTPPAAQPVEEPVQEPTPWRDMGTTPPAAPKQEDFCFCHDGVSLQIVSGGAAPEGYLGKVTLLIDGKYVDYVKAQPVQPVQEPVAIVVSSGPAAKFPMLQWVSAEHSLSTPIGTKLYTTPLPVQEPVAYAKGTYAGRLIYDTINPAVCLPVGMAFYTAPPLPVQRKPLDEWVIDGLANNIRTADPVTWWRQLARDVEAAHGIKEQP
jgi:hypothetical protein